MQYIRTNHPDTASMAKVKLSLQFKQKADRSNDHSNSPTSFTIYKHSNIQIFNSTTTAIRLLILILILLDNNN